MYSAIARGGPALPRKSLDAAGIVRPETQTLDPNRLAPKAL